MCFFLVDRHRRWCLQIKNDMPKIDMPMIDIVGKFHTFRVGISQSIKSKQCTTPFSQVVGQQSHWCGLRLLMMVAH